MDKVMDYGTWYFRNSMNSWCKTKAGYREINSEPEIDITIIDRDIDSLIKALDEAGWIKSRLDERLRAEDLKITHRLFDLLDKK